MSDMDTYITNHPLTKFNILTDNCMTFVLDFYKKHRDLDMYGDLPHDYVTMSYKQKTLDSRLKRNGFKEVEPNLRLEGANSGVVASAGNICVCATDDGRFPFALGLRYDDSHIAQRTENGITLSDAVVIKEYTREAK